MSSTIAPVYRTEAGVVNHPVVNATIQTRCFDGSNNVTKKFKEVYIYWDGVSEWVETPVWDSLLAEIKVVLRVDNQCAGGFSYIDFRFNDYRLLDICCIDCPLPLVAAALPQATNGVPYNTTIQILGSGAYLMSVISKPAWMTIVLNPTTGVITLSGTPDVPGDVTIQLQAANCGGGLAPTIDFTLNVAQVLVLASRTPISTQPWSDIKWVPFLNKWVAITNGGTINRIATSPDLAVWTFFYSSTVQLNRICVGNNKVVIVGSGDVDAVVTSVDGTTWNPFTVPEVMQSFGVVYSPFLDLYILTNQLGTNKLMKSSDGEVWTSVTAPNLNNHRNVEWNLTTGLFIVCAVNGTGNQIITSPDGDNWTAQVTPGPSRFWARVRESVTGRIHVVSTTGAGGVKTMYSDDAVTWILGGALPTLNFAPQGIASAPGMLVIAGNNVSSGTTSFAKSINDGLTWQSASIHDGQWSGLDYGNDLFAAVGIGAGGSNSVLESGAWLD